MSYIQDISRWVYIDKYSINLYEKWVEKDIFLSEILFLKKIKFENLLNIHEYD